MHLNRRTDPRRAMTSTGPWRIGRHYGIHVYEGNRPVATFHDSADAEQAVLAVNSGTAATNDKLMGLLHRLQRLSVRCSNTASAHYRRDPEDAATVKEWRDCQEIIDAIGGDLRALIHFPESFAVLDSAE
jgi:hypothetical protein